MKTRKRPGRREGPLDPVFRHSLRECWLILCVLGVCLVWAVAYSWQRGYQIPAEPLEMTLGMPRWVFWGIVVPWGVATVFSVVFGLWGVADQPLGEDEPQQNGRAG